MKEKQIERAYCPDCDWEVSREEIKETLKEINAVVSEHSIKRRFSSKREGHAYFNRGHTPTYEYEE